MTHRTLNIILQEHAALSVVLGSLLTLLDRHRSAGTLPDFQALRAMLFYLDEFPRQRHHRKETEVLFPKLRARTPLARDMLDRLDHEHACGELRIRELQHALLAFEMLGPARRTPFEDSAQRYVDFYRAHMRLEEQQILPLAMRMLDARDWAEVDAAFESNRDPLTGHACDADHATLFAHIARVVPAPGISGPPG